MNFLNKIQLIPTLVITADCLFKIKKLKKNGKQKKLKYNKSSLLLGIILLTLTIANYHY